MGLQYFRKYVCIFWWHNACSLSREARFGTTTIMEPCPIFGWSLLTSVEHERWNLATGAAERKNSILIVSFTYKVPLIIPAPLKYNIIDIITLFILIIKPRTYNGGRSTIKLHYWPKLIYHPVKKSLKCEFRVLLTLFLTTSIFTANYTFQWTRVLSK